MSILFFSFLGVLTMRWLISPKPVKVATRARSTCHAQLAPALGENVRLKRFPLSREKFFDSGAIFNSECRYIELGKGEELERRFGMKTLTMVFPLILAMLSIGCVDMGFLGQVSLHPLYTEQDLVFEPALVGTWVFEERDTLTFRQAGANAYQLTFVEDDVAAQFDVHLVRLGNNIFLDFFPRPDLDQELKKMNSFYWYYVIRAHTIVKASIDGDLLQMTMMGFDGLKERLDIPHERLEGGGIVVTASTTDLQEFVQRYAEEPLAFGDPGTLHREERE